MPPGPPAAKRRCLPEARTEATGGTSSNVRISQPAIFAFGLCEETSAAVHAAESLKQSLRDHGMACFPLDAPFAKALR